MKRFKIFIVLISIVLLTSTVGFSSATPIQIPQNTVTKVATNVNSVALLRSYKIGRQMTWIVTVRATGTTGPTSTQMMNEGAKLFKDNPEYEVVESFNRIDVYVLCDDGGARGYYGKLIIWDNPTAGFNPNNGAFDVNNQDQHTGMLDLRFIQAQAPPTTLSADADSEDRSIFVDSTAGFVAGRSVATFTNTGLFYFGKQVGNASGSEIILDTPIDKDFPAGSFVIAAIDNMNVNGSVTTQIFQIGPVGAGTGLEIDITRVAGYIQDGSAMDDALFGALSALTYGVVLRHNNTVIDNIWNVKSNGELALICASDLVYTTKAPAGSFGARFRNSFSGQEKHGVTIRLAPGDILEILIQDDLTGLEVFNMIAQGHVVD